MGFVVQFVVVGVVGDDIVVFDFQVFIEYGLYYVGWNSQVVGYEF